MNTLLINFWVEEDPSSPASNHGPLFHRWLPDGEKDAIILDPGHTNAQLKVWFERLGYVDPGGFIAFDYKRQEIDPEIVPTQSVLQAGPLRGQLVVHGLSADEVDPLSQQHGKGEGYSTLGKRVVRLIYPPVARFLSILRVNYGQYWIRELEPWDSRKVTLGAYCVSTLRAQWSLDEGKTWTYFIPTGLEYRIELPLAPRVGGFLAYLTKHDWQELQEIVNEGYEPGPEAVLVARTHELIDQGNLRYAFVEGVSAIELALSSYVRRKLARVGPLFDAMASFWNLPLHAQVTAMAVNVEGLSPEDIELALNAISTRHKIVHEGWDPPDNLKNELWGLLKVIVALSPAPKHKFPSRIAPLHLMPVEQWEKKTT